MVQLALVLIGITSVHAVKLLQASSLSAHVYPTAAAEKVWTVHDKDSLKMIGIYVKAIDKQ